MLKAATDKTIPKRRILYIEDEVIIALSQKMKLEKFGYTVIHASTGENALEIISNNTPFDLVLSDIDLGQGLDGPETGKQILAKYNVPVVFMSGHTEPEVINKTEAITSYGYIVKGQSEIQIDQTLKLAFRLFEAHQKINSELTERSKIEAALFESEEKYRLAFIANNDSININTLDGVYVDINEGFTKLTGYTKEDVLGVSSAQINIWAIPEDRSRLVTALKEKGFINELESLFRCKDGSYKTAVMSARIITLQNKPHILSITKDITEKKQAEQALRISEIKYRTIVDSAQDAIIIVNNSGLIADWNVSSERMFGYSAKEALGQPIALLMPERFKAGHPQHFNAAMQSRKLNKVSRPIELVCLHKDGYEFPIELTLSFGQPGKDGFVTAIIRDITERKQAQQDLHESHELYQSIIKASPDSITITDLDGRLQLFSPITFKMFGYTPEDDVLGKPVTDFIAPVDRERAINNFRLMHEGVLLDAQYYKGLRKDGSIFDIEINGGFVRDDFGKSIKMIFTVRDVTERKEAEDKIKNLLAEKELILKEVHHRIKNYMNNIIGFLGLKEELTTTVEAKLALHEMQLRISNMQILYDQLYRSDNTGELSMRDYLMALGKDVVSNFPNKSKIHVKYQLDDIILPPQTASTVGILTNEIITNSMKYAFTDIVRDPEITIAFYKKDEQLELLIADNGRGGVDMSASTGFGFTLINALVGQLGATMSVDSPQAQGTQIKITFKI